MGAKNRRFSIGLSSMPPGDACRTSYPVAPLDRADKDNLSLRQIVQAHGPVDEPNS